MDILKKYIKEIISAGISRSAISHWKTGRRKPNIKNCIKIEQLTKGEITREQLRPDIFSNDSEIPC